MNQHLKKRSKNGDSPLRRAAETNIGGAEPQKIEGSYAIDRIAKTNEMNNTTRRIFKRMTVITLIVVLLMTVLVSCGGGQPVPTLKVGNITMIPDGEWLPKLNDAGEPEKDEAGNIKMEFVEKKDTNGATVYQNKFSSTELKAIAEMLSGAYSTTYNTQSMLIAASHGYDVTAIDSGATNALLAEGVFTKDGVNAVGTKIDGVTDQTTMKYRLRFVQNLIIEAQAKSSNPLSGDIFGKIKNNNENNDAYLNISAADVRSLINCFKITVAPTSADIIDTILLGIGVAVNWLTNTIGFGNYLVGICIFAIIIEILMLPFAIKQQKNSIKQARLRPKEMAIRNKYKGRTDQATMQKMQQEIQEFYQKEHFSPYSGCLSLLIQMPIIIALYNIVINPLHYVLGQSNEIVSALTSYATAATSAGGAGMAYTAGSSTISLLSNITDKGAFLNGLGSFEFFSISEETMGTLENAFANLPSFTVLGQDFGASPALGTFNVLLLVPVLTFVAYFITSKLNRKLMYQPAANAGGDDRQVACSNSMMDITMPAMSTFFTFMVPALVGVYWIFRSLVSLLKQFIISRLMPLPTFTEEDYKAAEREMKGKTAHTSAKSNSGSVRPVRSLHYIDDEDFEDTRERGLARKAALEEKERAEKEKQEQKKALFAAPIKEKREQKPEKKEEEELTLDDLSEKQADGKENKDTDTKTEE